MIKELTNEQRAEVLATALPYIRMHNGQIVVIKYGGNAMIDETLKAQVMEDIVLLWLVGVKVVLVHGGGPEINTLTKKLGKEVQFIDGQRVTDEEMVDIVQMVLAGKINKTLVGMLSQHGGDAVGLSGLDSRLIQAVQRDPKLGFVGDVTNVNVKPILDLLDGGYIPVISTLGSGPNGETFNINGDIAAAAIAGALNAQRLIMMTDIAGILRDKDDPESLIDSITVAEAATLKEEGVISGGMIPKVECCVNAIERGVGNVVIMDGRVPHAILMELMTDEGAGTMVTR
ncbi:MAG: acetylglutamate kinase [Eggerthellales bacterium]|nr:acetylglutamate kinase [Eggerthellales bacterium]